MTGLDGPGAAALFRPSFPQPGDAGDAGDAAADTDEQEEGENADDDTSTIQEVEAEDNNSDAAATITTPPAVSIPRAQANPDDPSLLKEHFSDTDQALSSYNTAFSTGPLPRSSDDSQGSVDSKNPQLKRRKTSTTSFVTASDGSHRGLDDSDPSEDDLEPPPTTGSTELVNNLGVGGPHGESLRTRASTVGPETPQGLSPSIDTAGTSGSATSLLRSQHVQQRGGQNSNVVGSSARSIDKAPEPHDQQPVTGGASSAPNDEAPHGLVRFNVPDAQPLKQEMQMRAKFAQHARKRMPRRFTRGKLKDGEIVKVEKMLVRMDICSGSEQPSDEYDEKDSLRVETRLTEKWREFMVVCRESHEDDAVLCLQMYKTRVSIVFGTRHWYESLIDCSGHPCNESE